tara:strand:+ start:696 stop:1121 length:426 start_codon:yes stop_codon:yes gene_type:complete
MKGLSAIMLKVGNFDFFDDIVIDTTIEGFIKRNLKTQDGWDTMIDNDNKTFIFFLGYDKMGALNGLIEELGKLPTDTPVVTKFEDVTDSLLYTNEFKDYTETCDRTKQFLLENLEIDSILEKITRDGIESLTETETMVLGA